MKCPKCQTEVVEEMVGGRKRQTCPKCAYMHYDHHGASSGFDEITDDILDELAGNGSAEILSAVLINTVFRSESGEKTSAEKIAEWCKTHGFRFSTFDGKDAHGKKAQFIRFSRGR